MRESAHHRPWGVHHLHGSEFRAQQLRLLGLVRDNCFLMPLEDDARTHVAAEALDNLVGQFSSKYDCFRELVQNSIDAGSGFIEIYTEFERGEAGGGTAIIHVDDDGQGMDRAIIDGQLTKLFSSKKEGDLTKIGKFGIGFVSIFALAPEAVIVHTGRGGEYWEVLFHQDRSFQLKALDSPVEGTQISLFLRSTEAYYQELVREIKAALSHWCCHSETEIVFEDRSSDEGDAETVNRPFEVEGDLMVRYEVPGTEIVAAYRERPVYGFYNRGLALYLGNDGLGVLEERADRYAHIAFKVKSRYLEHTLSRETVVRDENFHRAMEILDKVVDGALLDGLIAAIETLAKKERSSLEEEQYRRYLEHFEREPAASFEKVLDRKVIEAHHREPLSPREALQVVGYSGDTPRHVFVSPKPNAVTEEAAHWVTTFWVPEEPGSFLRQCLHVAHHEEQRGIMGKLFGRTRVAPHLFVDPRDAFFVVQQVRGNAEEEALLKRATDLLRRLDLLSVELVWTKLAGDSPPTTTPDFVSFREPDFAEPLDLGQSIAGRRIGVMDSGPVGQKIRQLSESSLEFGAYLLAQRLLLSNLADEPTALALPEVIDVEALCG